jgi:hypothetical protein
VPAPELTEAGFVEEVRDFMRDFPELNRLISGEESSGRLISYAIWLALDEWNTTPPLASATVESFPSRGLLLQLTLIHLLTSVGILKSRNRLAYNDGGFSVQSETQDQSYQTWIQLFRSQSVPRMDQLKRTLNIEGAWGSGIHTDYAYIGQWFDTELQ